MDDIKVIKKPEPTQADKLREAVVLMTRQAERSHKMFAEVVIEILDRIETLEKRDLTT